MKPKLDKTVAALLWSSALAARGGGKTTLPSGVPLQTPGGVDPSNIVFASQWDHYPREVSGPLSDQREILLAPARVVLAFALAGNPQ
jgi:hypothetical protein